MPVARLTIAIQPGDSPPVEVRLFRRGDNPTERGTFVLDDDALSCVLTSWAEHAGDLDHPGMMDLEHLSLDPSAPHFDPDARAWYMIEARDGDLWMTDIRWTADGARRVVERTQRYLSPTFMFDEDTMQITSIVNVALTALPAMHSAPELIAARAAMSGGDMEDENTGGGGDNAAAAAAILKAMGIDPKMPDKVAVALGLEPGASIDDIRAAIDDFAAKMQKVEDLLNGGAPSDAPAEPPPAAEPAAEMPARMIAELAALRVYKHDVETAERHALVVRMVTMGAEPPATAWADDSATTPAEPWASMSIVALRSRVESLAQRVPVVRPPAAASALTDAQIAIAKEYGIDPARYAQMRARAGRTAQ